jgi:hypothetical protein
MNCRMKSVGFPGPDGPVSISEGHRFARIGFAGVIG